MVKKYKFSARGGPASGWKKPKRPFLLITKALSVILSLFLLGVLAVVVLFIYYAKDLPVPEKFTERRSDESTKIFDRTGENLLYEMYGEEKREIVPLSAVPENLKKAIIITEDANFYSHFGIDIKAMGRAILVNLKLRAPAQGGSTIPQQLIRSTFLTREKTIKRKVREIILTLELSRHYSKNQILEFYLNQIPFGSNAYGVEAASKTFFNKSAKDLSLAESAVLAALIRAPSYLSPYGEHKDELLTRKDRILDKMAVAGVVTKEESELAKKENIKFIESWKGIKAPHFVLYIRDYLIKKYGEDFLQQKGLKVYTSLDMKVQELAEDVVKKGSEVNKSYKTLNAALVVIGPNTGEILAMVGSKDWFAEPYPKGCAPGLNCLFDPKFNVATLGARQPGSAFKPFVYATAFKKGYDDKYVVVDEETNFGMWGGEPYIPKNYDGRFWGPVTLRQALARSLNVSSVKVLAYLAGLEDSIKTAQEMGITTIDKPFSHYGLSLVLGGGEVKLLDMVSAYGVFATEGLRVPPVSILRIEDTNGNILEESKKTPKRILEENVAKLINDILADNEARTPAFGPASPLYLEGYRVSVKTGTTSDFKDGWIIGYTPSIVVGVWAGNNDNTPARKDPGYVSVGPIWHSFMEKFLLSGKIQPSILSR